MNWQAVGAIAEVLGSITVVVSLLYLAAEVRGSVRQARFDTSRELAARMSEASLMVATHRDLADLWRRGAGRFEDLDPVEQVRFRGLMNALFRGFEQQFLLQREGALDDDAWQAVAGLIRDFSAVSGARVYLNERSGWYAPSFREFLRESAGVDTLSQGVPMATQYAASPRADGGST